MFALTTISEPASEPITLDEAKLHLKVDHTVDDDLITSLIAGARRLTEKETNRRWITQTLKLTLPNWPCDQPYFGWENAIAIPMEPVAAVNSVKYYDFAATLQTMSSLTGYQVWLDHSPTLIAPAPYGWWPVLQPGKMVPIEVEFDAGVDVDVLPEDVKSLMKLVVGYWYEHRGDSTDPTKLGLPQGAERLVNMLSSRGYR